MFAFQHIADRPGLFTGQFNTKVHLQMILTANFMGMLDLIIISDKLTTKMSVTYKEYPVYYTYNTGSDT